jgi:hypothetical protein
MNGTGSTKIVSEEHRWYVCAELWMSAARVSYGSVEKGTKRKINEGWTYEMQYPQVSNLNTSGAAQE